MRYIPAFGLFIGSFVFGLFFWLYAFIVTDQAWGTTGVLIGLVLAGVGIIPVGILAAAFASKWAVVGKLVLGVVLTFGSRALALYFASKADRA
jgi:hypothetical protein